MKYVLIICLGLLISGARLTPVSANKSDHQAIENKIPAALRSYWFRKTHKEVIRGTAIPIQLLKLFIVPSTL
jgi:hypothetical protein